MTREQVLEEIIEGYRATILERYQYQRIRQQYQIPDSVTEETVAKLRNYFLDYVYPAFERREELNRAFSSLDDYIKHPEKLLKILWSASILIFRYGTHLRGILNAGLKAMRSFRTATKFEHTFVEEAIKNEMAPPYDLSKFNMLIKLLPREEIDSFIETSQSLFETLHDQVLITKMIEVITYLIKVMRKDEQTYSRSQISALELGLDMLREGNQLFNELTAEDQQQLISLIVTIERDNLHQIHSTV